MTKEIYKSDLYEGLDYKEVVGMLGTDNAEIRSLVSASREYITSVFNSKSDRARVEFLIQERKKLDEINMRFQKLFAVLGLDSAMIGGLLHIFEDNFVMLELFARVIGNYDFDFDKKRILFDIFVDLKKVCEGDDMSFRKIIESNFEKKQFNFEKVRALIELKKSGQSLDLFKRVLEDNSSTTVRDVVHHNELNMFFSSDQEELEFVLGLNFDLQRALLDAKKTSGTNVSQYKELRKMFDGANEGNAKEIIKKVQLVLLILNCTSRFSSVEEVMSFLNEIIGLVGDLPSAGRLVESIDNNSKEYIESLLNIWFEIGTDRVDKLEVFSFFVSCLKNGLRPDFYRIYRARNAIIANPNADLLLKLVEKFGSYSIIYTIELKNSLMKEGRDDGTLERIIRVILEKNIDGNVDELYKSTLCLGVDLVVNSLENGYSSSQLRVLSKIKEGTRNNVELFEAILKKFFLQGGDLRVFNLLLKLNPYQFGVEEVVLEQCDKLADIVNNVSKYKQEYLESIIGICYVFNLSLDFVPGFIKVAEITNGFNRLAMDYPYYGNDLAKFNLVVEELTAK